MSTLVAVRPGLARPVRPHVVAGVLTGALAVGTGAAGCVLLALNVAAGAPADDGPGFWPMLLVGAVAYGTVGGWLVARRAAGLLGPLFLAIALLLALALFGREYGVHGMQVTGGLPGDRWLFWTGVWVWVPGLLSVTLVVPLLLPYGALPSRRWRPAVVVAAIAVAVATVSWAVTPYDRLDGPALDATIGPNPVTPPAWAGSIDPVSGALLVPAAVLAVSALVARWRGTGPDERRALAWVLYGAALGLVCEAVAMTVPLVPVAALAVAALPAGCMVAVARHRLWDLRVVVRRSLLFGGLTGLVAAAYAGVVGLVGGAVGVRTGAPVLATAVVAMLVLPAHRVLRGLVNRIVYGRPEDPQVTTTRLGLRLGSAVTPEQLTTVVLPEILDEVVRALPLRGLSLVTADGRAFTSGADGGDHVELVMRYAGRQVGVLRAVPARGGLTRSERRALGGVAVQAAVAVHGVLLAAELQRERERVVVAREEERRRLRRVLHDGVGTALAAAHLQAETARDLMTDRPGEGLALLDRLGEQLRDAVHDVRAVTRDLRPAVVDELGLAGALREFAVRCSTPERPVDAEVAELGEVPAAVEVAAYLVVAELVTNACRHSSASRVRLEARRGSDGLRIRVSDDGRGTSPDATAGVGLGSVRHRVGEVGGRLVRAEGPGTVIDVLLPLGSR